MKRNENFWSYRLHKLGTPKVLRTDGQTEDRRSGPTTRPAFAKATQVKMRLGKTLFLPSDFKAKSFEKFILWEIAARKLDVAASEQQRHRSDCDDVKTSLFVC